LGKEKKHLVQEPKVWNSGNLRARSDSCSVWMQGGAMERDTRGHSEFYGFRANKVS